MKLWALERQLLGVSSVILAAIIVAGIIVVFMLPEPSCTDGEMNGNEEGIDCGGSCPDLCLSEVPFEPRKLWTRFFLVRPGVYDVGALIENVNLDTGSRALQYTFKLYDKSNVLVGRRTGKTFLLPSEKVLLFEPTIVTGANMPTNLEFRIDSVEWEPLRGIKPLDVDVISKSFKHDPHPTITAMLYNRALFEEPKIEVIVMLERSDGNVYAVSRTLVEHFASDSSRTITFTWPTSTLEKPENISFIIRHILEGF